MAYRVGTYRTFERVDGHTYSQYIHSGEEADPDDFSRSRYMNHRIFFIYVVVCYLLITVCTDCSQLALPILSVIVNKFLSAVRFGTSLG